MNKTKIKEKLIVNKEIIIAKLSKIIIKGEKLYFKIKGFQVVMVV